MHVLVILFPHYATPHLPTQSECSHYLQIGSFIISRHVNACWFGAHCLTNGSLTSHCVNLLFPGWSQRTYHSFSGLNVWRIENVDQITVAMPQRPPKLILETWYVSKETRVHMRLKHLWEVAQQWIGLMTMTMCGFTGSMIMAMWDIWG